MGRYEIFNSSDYRLPFRFLKKEKNFTDEKLNSGSANWHEDIEIQAYTSGRGIISLNHQEYEVGSGDIVMINSNVSHHTVFDACKEEKIAYFCLIISRQFCLENFIDTNDWSFEELFVDQEIYDILVSLEPMFSAAERTESDVLKIRLSVLEILYLLCKNHRLDSVAGHSRAKPMEAVKRAIGFIRTEYHRDISLDEVAELSGLSRSYFSQEFKRITGHTFLEYTNSLRFEKAQKILLSSDEPIWKVAQKCGFNNRSYFIRLFKKYAGVSPGEYRKAAE